MLLRKLFTFEPKHEPLISGTTYFGRVLNSFIIVLFLIVISLVVGMVGYHTLEGMDWVDSFANAAMILSGMGPLKELANTSAKIFAGFYALYSGLFLIFATGILLAPAFHRFLHKFHLEPTKKSKQ